MPSQRDIAQKVGVSVATVSRVIHGDPKVRPDLAKRVRAALVEAGYELDPVVSEGLSKVRRREFYRETLALVSDWPSAGEKPHWFRRLETAAQHFADYLGYKLDYYEMPDASPQALGRLTRMLSARGIRGVVLGPFQRHYPELPFPWEEMCWVSIGANFCHPRIFRVGRDFQADIEMGLEWLRERGSQRPLFLDYTGFVAHVQPIFKRAALWLMMQEDLDCVPYHEIVTPADSIAFINDYQPDGIIQLAVLLKEFRAVSEHIKDLPNVTLSTPQEHNLRSNQVTFRAAFEAMGQSAINIMHRKLRNGELGLSEYCQTVSFSALRTDNAQEPSSL